MKNIPKCLLSTLLCPALMVANAEDTPAKNFAPGLMVKEYARHDLQGDSRKQYQMDAAQFGDSLGLFKIAESVTPWHWKSSRNAVAQGYLEIPVDGEYVFASDSFYDRNVLLIDDKIVCAFRDGEGHLSKIQLRKGHVKLTSIGFVESRGEAEGIQIRWKPPGQQELSSIPVSYLKHEVPATPVASKAVQPGQLATHLITATNDYIVDAYHNGVKIPEAQREMLHEHYGATVEKILVDVQPGDSLVFHVVSNRLRWGGSRYFAVAGLLSAGDYAFVTDPGSSEWSVCDDPLQSKHFIQQRDYGNQNRALIVTKPWDVGDELMRRYAGDGYPGQAVWGNNASTWIKFVAGEKKEFPAKVSQEPNPFAPQPTEPKQPNKDQAAALPQKVLSAFHHTLIPQPCRPIEVSPVSKPTPLPVQIISATYGTGGKNADVTATVTKFVELEKRSFVVTPKDLGQDPNPYWNKGLHVVYIKDGVRRELKRGENETLLPHAFYAPQDKAELKSWITGSRWLVREMVVQFNPDGSLTGSKVEGSPTWEAVSNHTLRIKWTADKVTEYTANDHWGAFSNLKENTDFLTLGR